MSRATFADLVADPSHGARILPRAGRRQTPGHCSAACLSDLRAGEISAALSLPPNAVSYHLKQLSTLGLLQDHRSSSDGRDVYYRVDLEHLDRLYTQAGDALHPGLVPSEQSGADVIAAADDASARSVPLHP